MEKKPEKLYKYQSFEDQYSLINLKNSQVYFQDPNNFNDPFDCTLDPIVEVPSKQDLKKLFEHYGGEEKRKIPFEYFSEKIKETKLLTDSKYVKGRLMDGYRGTSILSLTAYYDSILMWSYYSEKHTGFCLGFDTSFAPFNKAFKVRYSQDFPSINMALIIDKSSNKTTTDPLLNKFINWEHEQEYRSFSTVKPRHFNYDKSALTDIYLGINISKDNEKTLKNIIDRVFKGKVNIWKAKPPQQKYEVEFDLLKSSN